jgi:sulfur relay (sulfurtransferase) DsrF/TusC family protein
MEFTERNVLILIRSKPYGQIFNFEGWRTSIGMYGMDHEPTLLFMGDGVYSLLKEMNDLPIRMFKSTFESFDGKICASARSLKERSIESSEIFDNVDVLDEEALGKLFTENEIVVTF